MTVQRRLVSAFIVWHLVATATAALPSATWVERSPGGVPNAIVRALDSGGALVARAVAAGRTASNAMIGGAVDAYLSLTGLGQRWGMFSTPWDFDRYWRVRYYIRTRDGRTWSATELIGPGRFDDRVRSVQSFRDSFRDKALELATDGFNRHRRPESIRPNTRPGELPDDLAPIGRYFARRFAAARLDSANERLVRIDVWVGSAKNEAPGHRADDASRAVRTAVLQTYASGPVEDRLLRRSYPPYHSVEVEADINWVLEYFEEQ